jgi:pyroglutamyl-peptidase
MKKVGPFLERMSSKDRPVIVRLFLTGFSSFPGQEVNPTELLLSSSGGASWLTGMARSCLTDSRVIQVNTIDCNSALSGIFNLDPPPVDDSTSTSSSADYHDVYVHLGVNAQAVSIVLEQQAVNEATFRVPDTRGYQPHCQKIYDEDDFGHIRTCPLPLDRISKETGIPVSLDAGKYICNYIYYRSLLSCGSSTTKRPSSSLFIHIPSFSTIPRGTTENDLNRILNTIVENLHHQSWHEGSEEGGHLPLDAPDVYSNLTALGFSRDQISTALHLLSSTHTEDVLRSNPELVIETIFSLESASAPALAPVAPLPSRGLRPPPSFDEYKMVLVARNDLSMGKGKLAAQCCHACLGSYKVAQSYDFGQSMLDTWEATGRYSSTLWIVCL